MIPLGQQIIQSFCLSGQISLFGRRRAGRVVDRRVPILLMMNTKT